MTVQDFVDLAASRTGGTPQKTGGGFVVRCPAHEDKRASLSVAAGAKGIILKCHAGCTASDVCASLGVKLADLFNDKPKGNDRRPPPAARRPEAKPAAKPAAAKPPAPAPSARPRIVAEYDYRDEKGALVFQVVRFDPKDFRQRRPDAKAKGGWDWKLGDVKRVLYRLAEVRATAKAGGTIYVVEGEKDADALAKLGLCATCNAGGAGKWLADYTAALDGACRLVVIADKDKPGREHALKVAQEASAKVKDIRIVECPNINGKAVKDAADFLAAGAGALELERLATEAKPFAVLAQEAGPVVSKDKPPELPQIVYEPGRGRFYVPTPSGDWMPIPESSLMVRIKRAGYREYLKDANGVKDTEHAKERIMDERHVSYAGKIAGYGPGLKFICGSPMLVTSGPTLLIPKQGDWSRLDELLQAWFGSDPDHGERQFWTVAGWMFAAHRSLVTGMATGQFGPGQALFLVGEGNTGKSVFQKLITKLLGGRVADPSRFLSGNEFTKDIFGAEHNAIEDTATARDLDSRRQFGQALKNLVVNQTHSLHGKGADALTVTRFCRVTVSLNNQPQDLMVLPELSGGVVDKTGILKVRKAKLPDLMDSRAVADFWAAMDAELPAFLHAMASTKLPKLVTSCETARRYGVASWQHPDVVNAVEDLSLWRRLMELIDHARPWASAMAPDAPCREYWQGTAQDLEALLFDRCRERAARLVRGPQQTGRELRALAEKRPERLRGFHSQGHQQWQIFPPELEKGEKL
jgi:hypothetical protein